MLHAPVAVEKNIKSAVVPKSKDKIFSGLPFTQSGSNVYIEKYMF